MQRSKFISRLSLSQTVMLTFMTLLCFFAGTYYVLEYKDIVFHEIDYSPGAIADSILAAYDNDAAVLPAPYDTADMQLIRDEIRYRRHLIDKLPDSAVNKMLVDKQLLIFKDSFKTQCLVRFFYGDTADWMRVRNSRGGGPWSWVNRSLVWWDYYFSYSYKYGKAIDPYHLRKPVRMNVRNYRENIDFFTKYPGFLLWALLIILQFGLFPVLSLCAWVLVFDFKKRFPQIYHHKWVTLRYTILSGAILSIFTVIVFNAFFNPNLIQNGLFHRTMSEIMISVSVLTCVAGNACFTGFMLISGSRFRVQTVDSVTDHDINLLNEMNGLFSKLLGIASIVLCIIVLTTGALYNSLNKMDFIKKITSDLGYSPLGYHYAILFATLCSIILLLFFIPAKMRLITIEDRLRKIDPTETRISQSADVLGVTKSILVVGLPLITGFIQTILSAMAK